MKIYLTHRVYCLFIIQLLFAGFAAFYPFGVELSAKAEDLETNQFFSDIGIIKTRNALPVEVRLKDLNGRPVNLFLPQVSKVTFA